MARYAQGTTVDPARTEQEIKALLRKHGATGIMIAEHSSYGGAADRVRIAFELYGRHIRFDSALPHPDLERYGRDNGAYRYGGRPQHLRRKSWQQEIRQRWRSLLLRIKARLEELEELEELCEQDAHGQGADMVDLVTQVFAAQIVLPGGHTLGEWAGPQVEEAYRTGRVPGLLPGAHQAPAILLRPAQEQEQEQEQE